MFTVHCVDQLYKITFGYFDVMMPFRVSHAAYIQFRVSHAAYVTCLTRVHLIIGGSRSEPHTSDFNQDFPFICMYICISAVRHSA